MIYDAAPLYVRDVSLVALPEGHTGAIVLLADTLYFPANSGALLAIYDGQDRDLTTVADNVLFPLQYVEPLYGTYHGLIFLNSVAAVHGNANRIYALWYNGPVAYTWC